MIDQKYIIISENTIKGTTKNISTAKAYQRKLQRKNTPCEVYKKI